MRAGTLERAEMPPTHDAEKTLRSFRKRRSTPACYPCFKRKVKCRGGHPCEGCAERGHPEICHVEELSKGSRRHPKGKAHRSASVQDTTADLMGSEPNVGQDSVASFVQNGLGESEKHDTFHVMGMSSSGFPISLVTFGQNGQVTDDQVPTRAEILQYYSSFRDLVMPLYPIVPDPLALETWIAQLLHNTHTLLDAGKFAVILSCLALGAQFTEAHTENRWETSQAFISRASTYLRRANLIFEPSTEVIQSLLMIGIGLQNLGLSHGAWNLLGLTYRCAQSLGLHHRTVDEKGAMLWTAVTWQDALMSLRYDRTPLPVDDEEDSMVYSLPPYYDMINKMCQAGRKLLRQPPERRHDPYNMSSRVSELETIVNTAPQYLSPHSQARTLQQNFQYYAFRVHSSLMIAEYCRPSFSVSNSENDNIHKALRIKGNHNFIVVVESFLELCTFSDVPLRLWSLRQAAISCALVLALLSSRFPCAKAQRLLRRIIDVLRTSGVASSLSRTQSEVSEIYGIHNKSAALLESILSRKNYPRIPEDQIQPLLPITENATAETSADDVAFELGFDEFLNWPEISLYDNTFSDSLFQANMGQDPGFAG